MFYTTTTETATTPCAGLHRQSYALTYTGSAAYDANNNGRLDNNESNIVMTMTGPGDGALYRRPAPVRRDVGRERRRRQRQRRQQRRSDRRQIEAFGDPEDFNNGVGQVGVRILSWREIR